MGCSLEILKRTPNRGTKVLLCECGLKFFNL